MVAGIAIWTLVASAVTAAMYVWDKRASIKDNRRIRERTLLIWSLLGGWPGGLIASRWLRHKTKKISYRTRFITCSTLHVVFVIALATWRWQAWS